MSLISEKPKDIPTGNALDDVPDDLLDVPTPPAYLKFSVSPAAMENPPDVDEVRTYVMRGVCTGEHGPLKRGDGELRYERNIQIQAIWQKGEPEPADDGDQTAMFDREGKVNEGLDDEDTDDEDAAGDDAEAGDDAAAGDDDLNKFDPDFSHNGNNDDS